MSEYTELVERAEFAATSAKNSAAQTKSDKDTVVSLYNEIKAIIDAGGGGGSCKFYECAGVAENSWSGYEWTRKEETKTEIDTTVEVTSFTVSGSGVSGLDSTFNKSSDTYNSKPVYTNTSNMYCWYSTSSMMWVITAAVGYLSTVYAHSANTSPEYPWDATIWYGTWHNENQLTNMVIAVDFPTEEVTTIVYEKATTITEGLSWTSVKPKVGKSYTEDALVEAKLYEGYSAPTDFIYHWSMSSASEFSEASISGAVVFGVENDRPVAKFDGNSQINYTSLPELPQGNAAHSIALWVRSTTPCTSGSPECLVGWGSTPYSATATALSWEFEGTSAFTNWRDFLLTSPVLTDGSWHHLVGTFDGTTAKLYVDGEQVSSAEATFAIGGTQFGIGGCFWTSSNMFTGSLSDIYIFNRSLSATDVTGLYKKYA